MLTTTHTINNKILQIISNVTGHEIKTLDVGLSLDTDLGIDSIKQIDILQKIVSIIPAFLRECFVEEGVADALRKAYTINDLMKEIEVWLALKLDLVDDEVRGEKEKDHPLINSVVLDALSSVTGIDVSELEMDMRMDADLGIDSIKQISLINRLGDSVNDKEALQLAMTSGRINEAKTIGDLSALFTNLSESDSNIDQLPMNDKLPDKSINPEIPLVYAQYQHIISHYAMDSSGLCSKVRIRGKFEVKKLKMAWQNLVDRHPALRLVLSDASSARSLADLVLQESSDTTVPEIEVIDICHLNHKEQSKKIDTTLSSLLMKAWDIEQWPLHNLVLLKLDDETYQLFLSIHHLVADGLSNQILIRELFSLYDDIDDGVRTNFPPALSVKEYTSSLKKMNQSDDCSDLTALNVFTKKQGKEQFKWHPAGRWEKSHSLEMKSLLFTLDINETEELNKKADNLKVSLNSVLVATLLRVASRTEKQGSRFLVNIPTSGRIYEDIEVMDAVSDFAQNIVLDFDCSSAQGDWAPWARSVHTNIQDALAHRYDRSMIKQVAKIARITPLHDREIPKLQRDMLVNSVKSNLYLSYVGDSSINTDYKNIVLDEYHPATVTVRGGVDNLVELFNGQLHWSINYDASVISDRDIQDFGNELIQEIHKSRQNNIVEYFSEESLKNTVALKQEDALQITEIASGILDRAVSGKDFHHDFASQLGMDSLQRIRLAMHLRRVWPDLDATRVIKCCSLNEIASLVYQNEDDVRETPCLNSLKIESVEHLSISSLVDIQCKKSPDAIAIKDGNRIITYRELEKSTNQLANYLRHQGVQRNNCVGVMMTRGADMIVAILGILKAGGAYVPLDTGYPEERLGYILQHSEAKLLLTQSSRSVQVNKVIKDSSILTVIYLDTAPPAVVESINATISDSSDIGAYDTEFCDAISQPDDLMTILYTSGSTGNPKGVLLAHTGYINRIEWMADALHVSPSDNIAFKTSCCFDVSVWEIFLPLMYGATLVSADREIVSDPWALSKWMNDAQITIMHFVPSLFGEFLSVAEEDGFDFTHLRWLIFSGEALPVNFIRRWMDQYGDGIKLANLYGPTEASIDVTAHMITQRPGDNQHSIPIGRALPNTTILVLDENMQLCKEGVVGELYIAGVQLARGYFKDQEKTEKAFIKNPFNDIPGERIYRTGDLVSCSGEGEIDYRGRMDSQVKIRGFRVELGEIEAVLQSHDAVSEAVVFVDEVSGGDKKIYAIIHTKNKMSDIAEIRNYASKKLPDYMLPSHLNIVHEIPRNHNGKIDRKKLKSSFSDNANTLLLPKEVENIHPLAPAQRWLVNHFDAPHFWAGIHQFRYCDVLDTEVFKKALSGVVTTHEALRTQFVKNDGKLYQHILKLEDMELPVTFFEGAHLSADELSQEITRLVNEFKETVKIDQLALWRVYCIRESEKSNLFILVCHHMICDMLSSSVFLSDLWRGYCNALVDVDAVVQRKTSTMVDLVKTLRALDDQQLLQNNKNYWCEKFPSEHARFQVPLDHVGGKNIEQSEKVYSLKIDRVMSSHIMSASRKYCGVNLYPVLLSALYKSLAMWSRSHWVVISHRTHGRSIDEQQNYFDSVGNFAVNYPVGIDVNSNENYAQLAKKISQAIDDVPMKGVSYDYLGDHLPKHIYPDNKLTSVRANYLGNRTVINSDLFIFEGAELDRRLSSSENERTTLIEYIFSIVNGEIVLDISYSQNFHSVETIETIASMWRDCMADALKQFDTSIPVVSRIN